MANPAEPTRFTVIPDYDATSQFYHCSTCGMPHRMGSDEPVFRGNLIEMEGYYDICIDCARHVGELVGLVDPTENRHLVQANTELEKEMRAAQAENVELRQAVTSLRTINALDESTEVQRLTAELATARQTISDLQDRQLARLGDPEE